MVRWLRMLPAYLIGIALSVGIALIANARDWSGLRIFLVALVVNFFYVALILVPSLIFFGKHD